MVPVLASKGAESQTRDPGGPVGGCGRTERRAWNLLAAQRGPVQGG